MFAEMALRTETAITNLGLTQKRVASFESSIK
jgi:hypothetical protein